MKRLFPQLEPFKVFRLSVGSGHQLYVEQSGNPKGVPIVFLHGGPGGGISPAHRRFFDPDRFHAILFDQRGAGRSTPSGSIKNNTTWDLVNDLEAIRKCLEIPRWHLFGGSWGSTLAIAYAIQHPDQVRSLLLRGVFLMTKKEINWFCRYGASELFPEAWENFIRPVSDHARGDLVCAYADQLMSLDDESALPLAQHWCAWEQATSHLEADPISLMPQNAASYFLSFARIETHYMRNHGFFDSDGWILENLDPVLHLPCTIVQGRYDVICPVRSAWELHKKWRGSTLRIVPSAGHASSEPGIAAALIRALENLP